MLQNLIIQAEVIEFLTQLLSIINGEPHSKSSTGEDLCTAATLLCRSVSSQEALTTPHHKKTQDKLIKLVLWHIFGILFHTLSWCCTGLHYTGSCF